jgi:hypothetical protein
MREHPSVSTTMRRVHALRWAVRSCSWLKARIRAVRGEGWCVEGRKEDGGLWMDQGCAWREGGGNGVCVCELSVE